MQKICSLILFLIFSFSSVFAQAPAAPATAAKAAPPAQTVKGVSFFLDVLGVKGVLIIIFIMIFAYTYKNSVRIFQWIDNQTYGKKNYILKKLEILHIEVDPNKITYVLIFCSFGLGILTFCTFALMGNLALGVVAGIAVLIFGWKMPGPLMDSMERRRTHAYSLQMVDALTLLGNGIRAGLSVPQSLGMVVDELPPPVSQEFNLVLQQAKIGVPLDEAFENLKKRVYTEDNEMFVTSVNILRETGGNLAETFDTIVGVIRERVRLQLKIQTYIAQGKFQAYLIASMPYLMMLMFGSGDPTYFGLLFGTIPGILVFLLICGLVAVGMWIIFKIIQIKV